jgi:microcin C transport system permease protein
MATKHLTPNQRAWRRFRANRRGYYSLIIFIIIFGLSLFAEVFSNDKPLLVHYEGELYIPILKSYPETTFGGDFETETDYNDPYIRQRIKAGNNWAWYALNPHSFNDVNYHASHPFPAAPSSENYLGTDDRGRDVLGRLIYGFRISIIFAIALTLVSIFIGILAGAIQGYFGGAVDLTLQRFSEVWGSMPQLYLIIILASIFQPSIIILLFILSLFGWMSMATYVRAEFLRARNMEYVKAARALGQSNRKIIFRHLLPNTLTPVVTFLPFELSSAVVILTSLDFLGLGVPPSTPSLGELLSQGKESIEAWWLSMTTFFVLVGMLLLLTFIGEALREALDIRKG